MSGPIAASAFKPRQIQSPRLGTRYIEIPGCRQPDNRSVFKRRGPRRGLSSIVALTLGAMFAVTISPARADTIKTNLSQGFDHSASFADGIDASVALNAELATQRLGNDRLGTWTGTTVALTVNHAFTVSVQDPGVAVLPAEARQLFRITSDASVAGSMLGIDPVLSTLDRLLTCRNTALQCTSAPVTVSVPVTMPGLAGLTAPGDALGSLRLQAATRTETLFDGAILLSGSTRLSGSLLLSTTYDSKTPVAYASDALLATVAAGSGSRSARFGLAADDVRALRNATYTSVALPLADFNKRVDVNSDLQQGQALLAVARDTAALMEAGPTPGASFASRFALTSELWNTAALANPALGRSLAAQGSDDVSIDNPANEITAVRAALASSDDAGFLTLLAQGLNNPAHGASTPLFTLPGEDFGLQGALMQVYFTDGDPFGGQFQLDLAAADHHVLWRTGYDRISLINGDSDGIHVLFPSFGIDETVRIEDGEVYVGEAFSGLLQMETNGHAASIALNNFYSPRALVVASWGVSPVPEPTSAVMMIAGVLLLAARRKIARVS